jgi:hypothetical protein
MGSPRLLLTTSACLLAIAGGGSSLAATKATWKSNADPAWSSQLSGFQVSFFHHRTKLGVETGNWVTLRCMPSDGGPRTLVGGFGARLESTRHPAPARFRVGKAKAIKGGGSVSTEALHVPPGVPSASTFATSFELTRRARSLKGKLTFTAAWDAASAAPYSSCQGTFKIRPR